MCHLSASENPQVLMFKLNPLWAGQLYHNIVNKSYWQCTVVACIGTWAHHLGSNHIWK